MPVALFVYSKHYLRSISTMPTHLKHLIFNPSSEIIIQQSNTSILKIQMKISFFSLGDHCNVGFAIRKFFREEPSSPFDWLITPTNALIDIFNTNGEKFGLSVSYAMDGHSIICESYGCYYHHEFRRNQKDHCILTIDDMKNCREKLLHKYKKMIDLSKEANNPVFIRYINSKSYPLNNDAFIYPKKTIAEIHQAIKNAIGHDQFILLFTTIEKTAFQDNLIEPCELVESGKVICTTYSGDYSEKDIDDFWAGIFRSPNMTLPQNIKTNIHPQF